MSEAEYLPSSRVKSDLDLAIDALVDDVSEMHPNLAQETLRERISTCVREYMPSEDDGDTEGDEEEGAGAMGKAKGLAKQALGTVTRNEEMQAEGRLEREGAATEGNRAYFRSLIDKTNSNKGG